MTSRVVKFAMMAEVALLCLLQYLLGFPADSSIHDAVRVSPLKVPIPHFCYPELHYQDMVSDVALRVTVLKEKSFFSDPELQYQCKVSDVALIVTKTKTTSYFSDPELRFQSKDFLLRDHELRQFMFPTSPCV